MFKEPKTVRDAEGLLHNENGPALIVEDFGIEQYYIHGVIHRTDGPAVVFQDTEIDNLYIIEGVGLCEAGMDLGRRIVMEPESLTVEEIDGIENLEIRRIALDRHGVEKYLQKANAKVIDQCTNDVEMTKEALISTKTLTYFCGVCRSTGRMYYISVPTTIKTCLEAREYMASGKKYVNCVGAS